MGHLLWAALGSPRYGSVQGHDSDMLAIDRACPRRVENRARAQGPEMLTYFAKWKLSALIYLTKSKFGIEFCLLGHNSSIFECRDGR
ncbi:hypothetical protein AVEN_81901-1 [Araneus ventricosus]|uniref:Uncharacterized protein n=1 Tax=Araneus ventricosus TaxID=182803 RepID=A0A4Y2I583_ARAVE|nr:hypothetical protein AVEN_81901-1 [Araneus ventricosus]